MDIKRSTPPFVVMEKIKEWHYNISNVYFVAKIDDIGLFWKGHESWEKK
jgi:hypothetical protein